MYFDSLCAFVINDDGDVFGPFQNVRIRHWLCDVAKLLLWDDVTYTVSDNCKVILMA